MSASTVAFIFLLGLCHASDSGTPAQLGPPSLGFVSSVRSVCRPIPSTLALCHGIGYRQMRIPNLLGHDSLREAQQQSGAWLPLVSKLCHRDTKKFLCSLFAPVCLPELRAPVSPCRSLCEAVRDGCVPVMSAFGFPWPEMFNCTRFPRGTELCIPATGEHETRTAEEVHVICDACSLAAEGETDIQDNFCHSPYGENNVSCKIYNYSITWLLLILSTKRCSKKKTRRILRWAGGGAERAEGVGGAMAHSALWLQEGGTCTCRGRLVLTRLVRWTRDDKELRKFIRALLKQPCPDL
uniref:FZ domain-containing protein n=1 Tax=Sphaeramia orbicularis TaxID=375764 RepID=A0A673BA87_9TELE